MIGLLCSRSWSWWRFKTSLNVCQSYIYWTTDIFTTNLVCGCTVTWYLYNQLGVWIYYYLISLQPIWCVDILLPDIFTTNLVCGYTITWYLYNQFGVWIYYYLISLQPVWCVDIFTTNLVCRYIITWYLYNQLGVWSAICNRKRRCSQALNRPRQIQAACSNQI